MVIDGTRMPRYRADIGVKDGKIAKIGNLKGHQGKRSIDAGGLNVVPGFVDLHTHYDAQKGAHHCWGRAGEGADTREEAKGQRRCPH
jgi:N-acyl-D-aspartate/D-glutamate deacylase